MRTKSAEQLGNDAGAGWIRSAEMESPAEPSTIHVWANADHDTEGESGQPTTGLHEPRPSQIGRYEIQDILGEGEFGRVFLAYDPQLQRQVAIKVPGRNRLASAASVELFLREARAAASLSHAGLVGVHDVQRQGNDVFIVQEYIEGQDLSHWARANNPSPERIVALIKEILEAVGFAHQHDLVHRDLKPANLLVDEHGHPHVADFGLALNESVQRLRRGEVCGTPAYMSPEQVCGLSHVLDGRSDLWSIGVIFYELLTGRRPFSGDSAAELFDEVQHREPKPPRMIRPEIPAELERICLKCLAKRQTDRYLSAAEMLEDLDAWSALSSDLRNPYTRSGSQTIGSGSALEEAPLPTPRIVPKGLRSFDEHDADFFLELLPGARDRDGLPESIRFWKVRLEDRTPGRTFRVGLMYGPSGCGKSSLAKAGLLPRLAQHVEVIYLEAMPQETERQLLRALQRRLTNIPNDISLPDLFGGLREGLWASEELKVCLVLDQFEQWLHAHQADLDTPLVQALRHCDGVRLQCLVLTTLTDTIQSMNKWWKMTSLVILQWTANNA